jgi:hypothetical protein
MTAGKSRARNLHLNRRAKLSETMEPNEADLPEKPLTEEMPEEVDDPEVPGEEPVPDEDFASPQEANVDETIDNEESETYPDEPSDVDNPSMDPNQPTTHPGVPAPDTSPPEQEPGQPEPSVPAPDTSPPEERQERS